MRQLLHPALSQGVEYAKEIINAKVPDRETRGNCHAYVIAGSLALTAAGIDHHVAYANYHSMVLLPDDEHLWLLDLNTPKLQQPIEDKLDICQEHSRERKIGKLIRTRVLADSAINLPLDDALEKIYWLRSPLDPMPVSSSSPSLFRTNPDKTLVMAIYPPGLGRIICGEFSNFRKAYVKDDIHAASEAIVSMGPNFPETDMRSRIIHKHARSIVKRLALKGVTNQARATSEALLSSLGHVNDSRLDEYRADFTRYIGQAENDRKALEEAASLYLRALEMPNAFTSSILQKIALCQQQLKHGD